MRGGGAVREDEKTKRKVYLHFTWRQTIYVHLLSPNQNKRLNPYNGFSMQSRGSI